MWTMTTDDGQLMITLGSLAFGAKKLSAITYTT